MSGATAQLIGGGLALAGALLVFIFNIVYTEFREARQAARERAGLARLVADEVERNEGVVEIVPPSVEAGEGVKEILQVNSVTVLPTIGAWLEARVRLAQLIARQDFDAVADYYQVLQALATPSGATKPHRVRADRPGWKESTSDVKNRLAKYAEPSRIWRWLRA